MNALLALLIIAYVVLAAFFKFPSWLSRYRLRRRQREQRQHLKFPRLTEATVATTGA
jgi:Flp pilus assembly protein TadB